MTYDDVERLVSVVNHRRAATPELKSILREAYPEVLWTVRSGRLSAQRITNQSAVVRKHGPDDAYVASS